MNRHERRKQAAEKRHYSFVEDYVHHLPEITPEQISAAGITHLVFYHDDWCKVLTERGTCNCEPAFKFFREPVRS